MSMDLFMLQRIPTSLYQEIQLFLSSRDYYTFLITSKQLFQGVKYETFQYSLTDKEEIQQLLINVEFQQRILSHVMKTPNLQLTVKFHDDEILESYFSQSNFKVKKFTCENTRNLHIIPDWKEKINQYKQVCLKGNSVIDDFSELNNLQSLTLVTFQNLTNCFYLSHLTELNLYACFELTDVSALSHLKKLTLQLCHKVTDVSALGDVSDLTITDCRGISDITALIRNEKLSISECPHIRYLSSIPKDNYYSSLNLSFLNHSNFPVETSCTSLSSILTSRLKTLTLSYCYEINDLSFFHEYQHLYSVTLFHCRELHSLKGLSKVPILQLQFCYHLVDITDLNPISNRSISIEYCNRIENYQALNGIKKVKLLFVRALQLKTGIHFTDCHHVIFDGCQKLSDISMLSNLLILEFWYCDSLLSLEGLLKIPTIVIVHCSRLLSLKGLGENKQIILDQSESLLILGNDEILLNHYQQLSHSFLERKDGENYFLIDPVDFDKDSLVIFMKKEKR